MGQAQEQSSLEAAAPSRLKEGLTALTSLRIEGEMEQSSSGSVTITEGMDKFGSGIWPGECM